MSEFHEEFEAAMADPRSATAQDPLAGPEPETADVDAGGGGSEPTPAGPAGSAGADGPDGGSVAGEDLGAEDAPGGAAADAEPGAPGSGTEPDAESAAPGGDRAAEYLALAQRTKADFDNFRKRAARDAALAAERGTIKLARELLPALDNLERAITHAAEDDPLLNGIKLVHSDLLAALKRSGIEAFSPAGESFDPQLHEAVAQHAQDGAEAGTVLEVYQAGYRLGDTVLRPARVLVAA
ncbi:MAG TPA: nucleotide exchange factor GrpE [Solirubrobacteraceae bacterium]|nr:nucleotide exchange factor GrpE [Solirubrobacteraceae bacterium]